MKPSDHKKPKRKFNRAARTMLPVLVKLKDRVRSYWPILPIHRESEGEAVMLLLDELIDGIIDDTDISDKRAASMLGAIDAFINSTYWPEQPGQREEA